MRRSIGDPAVMEEIERLNLPVSMADVRDELRKKMGSSPVTDLKDLPEVDRGAAVLSKIAKDNLPSSALSQAIAEEVVKTVIDTISPKVAPNVEAQIAGALINKLDEPQRIEAANRAASLGKKDEGTQSKKRQEEWTAAQWENAIAAAAGRIRERLGEPEAEIPTKDLADELGRAEDPALKRVVDSSGLRSALRNIQRKTAGTPGGELDLAAKYLSQKAKTPRWDSAKWKKVIRAVVKAENAAGREPSTENVAAAIARNAAYGRSDFTAENLRQIAYDKKEDLDAKKAEGIAVNDADYIDLRQLGVLVKDQQETWGRDPLVADVNAAIAYLDSQRGIAADAPDKPSYGTVEVAEAINAVRAQQGLPPRNVTDQSLRDSVKGYGVDLRSMRVRMARPAPRWSTEVWINKISEVVNFLRGLELEPRTDVVAFFMTRFMIERVMRGEPIPEGFKEITTEDLLAAEQKHFPSMYTESSSGQPREIRSLEDLGVVKRPMTPGWNPAQWSQAIDYAILEASRQDAEERPGQDARPMTTAVLAEILSKDSFYARHPDLGPARMVRVGQIGQAVRRPEFRQQFHDHDLGSRGVKRLISVSRGFLIDQSAEGQRSRHETVADQKAKTPEQIALDEEFTERLHDIIRLFTDPQDQEIIRRVMYEGFGRLNMTKAEDTRWRRISTVVTYLLSRAEDGPRAGLSALLSRGMDAIRQAAEEEINGASLGDKKAPDIQSLSPLIIRLAEAAYRDFASERGLEVNSVHYSPQCEPVSRALSETPELRSLNARVVSYQGWDITHHDFIIIGTLVIDATWQQFLDHPNPSLPKVLIADAAELPKVLSDFGVDRSKHHIWLSQTGELSQVEAKSLGDLERLFFDGRIYDPDFIRKEQQIAAQRTTLSVDLDRTLISESTKKIRPALIELLRDLKQKHNVRLVLFTAANKAAVRAFFQRNLQEYPDLLDLFELAITYENYRGWTDAEQEAVISSNVLPPGLTPDRYREFNRRFGWFKQPFLLGYRAHLDDDNLNEQAQFLGENLYRPVRINEFDEKISADPEALEADRQYIMTTVRPQLEAALEGQSLGNGEEPKLFQVIQTPASALVSLTGFEDADALGRHLAAKIRSGEIRDAPTLKAYITGLAQENFKKVRRAVENESEEIPKRLATAENLFDGLFNLEKELKGVTDIAERYGISVTPDELAASIRAVVFGDDAKDTAEVIRYSGQAKNLLTEAQIGLFDARLASAQEQINQKAQESGQKFNLAIQHPGRDLGLEMERLKNYKQILKMLIILHEKNQPLNRADFAAIEVPTWPVLINTASPEKQEHAVRQAMQQMTSLKVPPLFIFARNMGLNEELSRMLLSILTQINEVPERLKKQAIDAVLLVVFALALADAAERNEILGGSKAALEKLLREYQVDFLSDSFLMEGGGISLSISGFINSITAAAQQAEVTARAA